jgi:hypothetical protein
MGYSAACSVTRARCGVMLVLLCGLQIATDLVLTMAQGYVIL